MAAIDEIEYRAERYSKDAAPAGSFSREALQAIAVLIGEVRWISRELAWFSEHNPEVPDREYVKNAAVLAARGTDSEVIRDIVAWMGKYTRYLPAVLSERMLMADVARLVDALRQMQRRVREWEANL